MLDAAREEFRRRLAHLTPQTWAAATPCPDWTARDLVNHVVGGERMTAALLDGATTGVAVKAFSVDWLAADDPLVAFDAATAALDAAAGGPGALDRVVQHPVGPVPGRQAVEFRVAEHLVHAWDLARALDVDDVLDPDLVARTWEAMRDLAPVIGGLGVFGAGPSGALGEGSPLQDRLLDLSGRRP
ncbi:TIGR03086 family metal-binding protein [Actinosynnema sp. NPDC050436]|uniref:TIGR03086 family metal-binding protein n=1 Tax=Actinosynnema sp. NPDC050436 TaxID=3155659 RepID=UPI0033EE9B49